MRSSKRKLQVEVNRPKGKFDHPFDCPQDSTYNNNCLARDPEIQVRYHHTVLARRPRDLAFANTLAQYLTVWQYHPVTGHYWIDFAQYAPVQDRVRYLYSWDGNATSQPVMDVLNGHPCQEQCKLPSPQVPLGRLIMCQERFEESIVLLLESPHNSEVDEDMKPCAPAVGSTGQELHKSKDAIGRMLKAHGVAGLEVPVIICNPVPYPTSCRLPLTDHEDNANWRNDVFAGCIRHQAISQAFHAKLIRYRPIAVINACTGSYNKDCTAKWYVRSEISAAFGDCIARPHRYARSKGRSPLVFQEREDRQVADLFPAPAPNAIVHIELPHPSDWGRITKWPK